MGDSATARLDVEREIRRCSECSQRFGVDAQFCPFCGVKLQSTMWDASADPLLGQTIDGRYEVLAVLGEGGMGVVYKVRHTAIDRLFALKALRPDLARDSQLAARFVNEAKATAALKHEGIVQITDFGRLESGAPYFVMELLVGRTLASALRGGPLPPPVAVHVALRLAEALQAAHDAQVVHRDLKPENVFLVGGRADEDMPDDVKVLDFGTAKILGSAKITKTGIVFGTPHYMSPEQAAGQTIDHRVDVYALGVILYEMLTGRVPFEGESYMGVLTQHIFVVPKAPSEHLPALKEIGPLEEIVLRALEKKPEDRFTTMADVAVELRRVAGLDSDAMRVAPRKSSKRPSRGALFHPVHRGRLPSADEIEAQLPPVARIRRAWIAYAAGVGVVGLAIGYVARAGRPAVPVETPPASVLASAPTVASATSGSPGASVGALPAAVPSSAVPSSAVAATSAPAPVSAGPRRPTPPKDPWASLARPPVASSVPARSTATPRPTAPDDFADPWRKH